MDSLIQAQNEGYSSYGWVGRKDNPYDPATKEYAYWNFGWDLAHFDNTPY